jgi:hypothetical protein
MNTVTTARVYTPSYMLGYSALKVGLKALHRNSEQPASNRWYGSVVDS